MTPDAATAAAAREDGMTRAVRHAGWTWVEYATEFIRVFLIHHRELFVDDVWAAGLATPDSPRAFGQPMKSALAAGWMHRTEFARPSVRSNLAVRPVYASRIHDPRAIDDYPTWTPDPGPAGDELGGEQGSLW
jgi:hypothetical protein